MLIVLRPKCFLLGFCFCSRAAVLYRRGKIQKGVTDKQIKAVTAEVLAGEGKAAKKKFVKELKAKSKAKDVDAFTRDVNAAHERYEVRKDVIMTKKQTYSVIKQAVVDCAIIEGQKEPRGEIIENETIYAVEAVG